jgi:hypothetical protein
VPSYRRFGVGILSQSHRARQVSLAAGYATALRRARAANDPLDRAQPSLGDRSCGPRRTALVSQDGEGQGAMLDKNRGTSLCECLSVRSQRHGRREQ